MKENNREFFEDLVKTTFNPDRIQRLSTIYEFNLMDYMENVI
jgi:hypothetical protein